MESLGELAEFPGVLVVTMADRDVEHAVQPAETIDAALDKAFDDMR
jgi:hypothetical protein